MNKTEILKLFRSNLEGGMDVWASQNAALDVFSPGPPYKLEDRKKINAIVQSKEGLEIAREFVKPETWEVHSLDVWGNEEDGFEVNNEFKAGEIEIPHGATDEELLEIFKESHLQSNVTLKQIEFDEQSSEGFFVVANKKTGEPLYNVYNKR